MQGQACTRRVRRRGSRTYERCSTSQGADGDPHRGRPWSDLPLDCWRNILQFADPPAIARFAAVNQECRTLAYDNELWKLHFRKTWSPEYCGSLQTKPDGKDFCSLYSWWQTGKPAVEDLIPRVHLSDYGRCGVAAIQLRQAGALEAWSVGWDWALVGTDMATCQILKRYLPQSTDDLLGVTVLDSMGLICAGGTHITAWDPRQPGNGPSANPVFSVEYRGVESYSMVHSMISANSFEGSGPAQLLTGGTEEVYLWDLRNMDEPVREYESIAGGVNTLLREPRYGTLLAGGVNGVTCSDFNTGVRLSTLRTAPHTHVVSSLAAGRDRLISVDDENVTEWALPDPRAIVEEPQPNWVRPLGDNPHTEPVWIQGLGEDLQRILVGTRGGSICMWECLEDPGEPPICWSLGDPLPVGMTCATATDQLVVTGLTDGALRVVRLNFQFVQDVIDVM